MSFGCQNVGYNPGLEERTRRLTEDNARLSVAPSHRKSTSVTLIDDQDAIARAISAE